MAEYSSPTYSEVDASNNAAPPDGAPAGTFPNQSEGIWRATLGATKRFWDRMNGTVTTTGSVGAYVYTPSNTSFPTAYVSGEEFTFKANFTSVGGDTLNINTLGARPIVKAGGTGLAAIAAGDIQINQHVKVQYNSTFGGSGAVQMLSPVAVTTASNAVTGGTPSIANHVPKYSDTTGLALTDGYAVGTAASSLVQLDGTANLTLGSGKGIKLVGSGTGSSVLIQAASSTLAQTVSWPPSLGISGNVIQTDGSGNLSFVATGGKVAQVVKIETGAVATGSTAIPFDDTIPQNTEGTQFMTLSITPTNASSTLIIQAAGNYGLSAGDIVAQALFQDSTANALAVAAIQSGIGGSSFLGPIYLTHTMTAGTTSATTFKIRAGSDSGVTLTFNGYLAARKYGGVMASEIVITEVTP